MNKDIDDSSALVYIIGGHLADIVQKGQNLRLGQRDLLVFLNSELREGQYNDAQGEVQDYRPVWLLDGSVYWQNDRVRVSADCTNMTNCHYYDYGGLLQPGAWAKLTITARMFR